MKKTRVIIMGAAGRDYHNFNVYFRDNPNYEVVAFTASQIPTVAEKRYPKELSGKLYPEGISIYGEEKLPQLIENFNVDKVVLAYSDLSYEKVMHKAAIVNACGANFELLGPEDTMLKAKVPVIAVCAVRTGCGKSQTTNLIAKLLREQGIKFVIVRHPMPYGDLSKQVWQRFETMADLKKYDSTIEEREEYEPHIKKGNVVYAGVDYQEVLRRAEKEAEVILWDGGNNDFPFFEPNLLFVLTDPHRPGHEVSYYPGEINLRMADVVIINKQRTANPKNIEIVKENIRKSNPQALILNADSEIMVNKPERIKGKRVLVIEDGPTLTHGEMKFGAGFLAAKRYKCKIVDPRPYAVGSLRKVLEEFKLEKVVPAMGYSEEEKRELKETINKAKCDVVIGGTPVDLRKILKVNKPIVKINYKLVEIGEPYLWSIIDGFLSKFKEDKIKKKGKSK